MLDQYRAASDEAHRRVPLDRPDRADVERRFRAKCAEQPPADDEAEHAAWFEATKESHIDALSRAFREVCAERGL
jgi:hypothetical protein